MSIRSPGDGGLVLSQPCMTDGSTICRASCHVPLPSAGTALRETNLVYSLTHQTDGPRRERAPPPPPPATSLGRFTCPFSAPVLQCSSAPVNERTSIVRVALSLCRLANTFRFDSGQQGSVTSVPRAHTPLERSGMYSICITKTHMLIPSS